MFSARDTFYCYLWQRYCVLVCFGIGNVFLYVSLYAHPKYRRHRDFTTFKEMDSVTYDMIEIYSEEDCHKSL